MATWLSNAGFRGPDTGDEVRSFSKITIALALLTTTALSGTLVSALHAPCRRQAREQGQSLQNLVTKATKRERP